MANDHGRPRPFKPYAVQRIREPSALWPSQGLPLTTHETRPHPVAAEGKDVAVQGRIVDPDSHERPAHQRGKREHQAGQGPEPESRDQGDNQHEFNGTQNQQPAQLATGKAKPA